MSEDKRVMPVFVFARRRDIELETGLTLAGKLIVDIPKTQKPKRRDQRLVAGIVQQLAESARQMPDDAIIYGWPKNCRPANADETIDNEELMANWAKDRMSIEVRVDPRNDGMLRIDSDLARHIGLREDRRH